MWKCNLAVDLDAAVHFSLKLLLGTKLVRRDSISVTQKDDTHFNNLVIKDNERPLEMTSFRSRRL